MGMACRSPDLRPHPHAHAGLYVQALMQQWAPACLPRSPLRSWCKLYQQPELQQASAQAHLSKQAHSVGYVAFWQRPLRCAPSTSSSLAKRVPRPALWQRLQPKQGPALSAPLPVAAPGGQGQFLRGQGGPGRARESAPTTLASPHLQAAAPS